MYTKHSHGTYVSYELPRKLRKVYVITESKLLFDCSQSITSNIITFDICYCHNDSWGCHINCCDGSFNSVIDNN